MSRPSQACGAFKTQEKPPTTINFGFLFQNPRSAWLQLWWSGLRLAANFRTTYLFNTIFNFGNSKKFYKAHPRTLQCNFRDLRNAEATTEKAKLARSTFLSSTQDFTITFDPTDSRTWPIPMTRLEEKIFPKTVSKELHKTEDWALPSERRFTSNWKFLTTTITIQGSLFIELWYLSIVF